MYTVENLDIDTLRLTNPVYTDREDDCRVGKGNASENLAVVRHIA